MKLAALQHELTCECCAHELDILHDVIKLSDVSIAKALMISEVAQIARLEMRMRDYLTGKWRNRAKEAAAKAGSVVSGGGSLKAAYASVDATMGKWAKEVEARAKTDLENVYYLARKAGWKKGTGQTKASLQYVVPNFTDNLEAGDESVAKAKRRIAEALPSFDLRDEKAVKDLQDDQMLWIGRHYGANLRAAIRNAVEPGMVKGIGHDKAGKIVRDAVYGELGKVTVPGGFNGSDAKYFEGIAANVSTNARVRGQLRSFSDLGVTKYEIVNPMDDRTTQICAFMNGTVFEVKDGDAQMGRSSAAKNPMQVKEAHPWLPIGKIKSIASKGGMKGLVKAGLALPPYHFRCRSTIDISIESMSFDSLDRGAALAPEPATAPKAPKGVAPKAPKDDEAVAAPVAPSVPSTRLGEIGEKVFGRKLTDAEIDDLSGVKAKLPPDHKMVVSVRENVRRDDSAPQVTIGAGIVDKKNNVVGTFTRQYRKEADGVTVHHASFFIDKKLQKSGMGRELFNAQIDAYEKHGVAKVYLEAAEVGKYVWTKAGFEWTNPAQVKTVFSKFEKRLKREVGSKAAAEIMTSVRTPEDLSRVVVGDKRIGKKFLIDLSTEPKAGVGLIEMAQKPARIKRL